MRDGLPTPLSNQFYLEEHEMRANNLWNARVYCCAKIVASFSFAQKEVNLTFSQ